MAAAQDERIEAIQTLMGTQFRVLVYAADRNAAERAVTAAFARGQALNRAMSDYLEDSELNRLCRAQRMRVSEDLFAVLGYSQRVAKDSQGAFDVTLGPMIRLWRESRRRGVLPAAAEIDAARARCGFRKLTLHRKTQEVRLARPDMQLDLGGIAKGYAADAMLRVLREAGFPSALVAASGDLAIGDPPPGKPGWRVELGATDSVQELHNCGVSTSGDESQFVEIGGVRYSHILDPRTGIGLKNQPVVTVVAPTATESDALATASSVWNGRAIPRHPRARFYISKRTGA